MIRLIQFILILVTTSARSRLSLQAENAALRHQLSVYRKSGKRPRIRPADRMLWSVMRIKLDENLPVTLVDALRTLGHDVDTVAGEALT